MKRITHTLAGLVLTAASLLTISCQESLEERAAREANDYTAKHCPAPVAKGVVMDSMTFTTDSHTFSYYYKLSGVIDDTAYIARNNPQKLLLQQVRNSTHLKLYKEAGYNFRYVYTSTKNSGTKLFDATYREKDYR